ncbi:MAG: divalent-cation tolerance protein CutA [Candidatus Omnitrophota bacterium]|jgi:periplasmic divalent cation tolerance protein
MAFLVLVTIPKEKAVSFSKRLLKEKACACISIIEQINSFFWWKGKIEQGKESLLLLKTSANAFVKLKKAIRKHHPYSVPEIIAFNIDKIDKAYFDWLKSSIAAPGKNKIKK